METKRVKVLFVCIGNSCRSPMAEAVARQDAPDIIEAFSAGLAPLGFLSDMTKQTLLQNGYSIERLRSKPIRPEIWEQADIVINMSGGPRELAFRQFGLDYTKVEDWDIPDPYGDSQLYSKTFGKIRQHVTSLAQRLSERVSVKAVKAPAAGLENGARRGQGGKTV